MGKDGVINLEERRLARMAEKTVDSDSAVAIEMLERVIARLKSGETTGIVIASYNTATGDYKVAAAGGIKCSELLWIAKQLEDVALHG